MAASATFALKAGVWFRRARLLIVSPDSRVNLARRQAETPLIPLFRFLRPALNPVSVFGTEAEVPIVFDYVAETNSLTIITALITAQDWWDQGTKDPYIQ